MEFLSNTCKRLENVQRLAQHRPVPYHEKFNQMNMHENIQRENGKGSCIADTQPNNNVILPTALVRVKTDNGWSDGFKMLIDQGSMVSIITEELAQKLKLDRLESNTTLVGIDDSTAVRTNGRTNLTLTARYPTPFNASTSAMILRSVTHMLPMESFNKSLVECSEMSELVMELVSGPNFQRNWENLWKYWAVIFTENCFGKEMVI